MLVLTRKKGERIRISDNISIEVVAVRGSKVRIGLIAPPEMTIVRAEIAEKPQEASQS